MVEFDGRVQVTGPNGSVPFLDLFHGRDELVVYKTCWYDGAPTVPWACSLAPPPAPCC